MDKNAEYTFTVGDLLYVLEAAVQFLILQLGRSPSDKSQAVKALGTLARHILTLGDHLALPETTGEPTERVLVFEHLSGSDPALLHGVHHMRLARAALDATPADNDTGAKDDQEKQE